MSVDGERRAEVVAPYGWVYWECGGDQGDRPVRTPAPTGGFDGPSQCDRAGAHCAPLQPVYQHHQQARRHLRHLRQRNNLQVSGASRGEAGKAAADAYSKVKDGGAISRYHPLSKSHRRRVRSTKLKIKHQSTEGAPCLGVLRG